MLIACRVIATFPKMALLAVLLASCAVSTVHFNSLNSESKVSLAATLNKPEGLGPFPAVVLLHGCGGLQPKVRAGLTHHADFLERQGFVTLIVDSFKPRGIFDFDGLCRSDSKMLLAREYRLHDAFAAAKYLRSLEFVQPENIFVVGQSHGGKVAMMAVQKGIIEQYDFNNKFRAAVAYYPFCQLPPELDSPLLVFIGKKDDWTFYYDCRRAKNWLDANMYQVVIYPNATHSFDLPIGSETYLGHSLRADRAATQDSRQLMLEFFRESMAK